MKKPTRSREERIRRRVEKLLAAKRAGGNWRRTLSKRELARLHGVPFNIRRKPGPRLRKRAEPSWPDIYVDDLLDEFDRRDKLPESRIGATKFGALAENIRWLRRQIEIRMLESLL
jgi:hypothetical protein